jgi:hypothetical protein
MPGHTPHITTRTAHPAHSILCLPYTEKNIDWALEQISIPYFVGEGKFTDISADYAIF